jgi:hypothetical protein
MTAKLPAGPTNLHKNIAVGDSLEKAQSKAAGKAKPPAKGAK